MPGELDLQLAARIVYSAVSSLNPTGNKLLCTRRALHDAFLARGEESPYAQWFERGFDESMDHRFTTFIDVSDFMAKNLAKLGRRG